MARYAIVDQTTNEIVNVAEWSGNTAWKLEAGLRVVRTDIAGPGWTHDPETGEFTPPPEE